jgi:hypothetical protein
MRTMIFALFRSLFISSSLKVEVSPAKAERIPRDRTQDILETKRALQTETLPSLKDLHSVTKIPQEHLQEIVNELERTDLVEICARGTPSEYIYPKRELRLQKLS